MSDPVNIWLSDNAKSRKRPVRIEVIGGTFALYEQQWRSEAYFFGDLVYRGKEGDFHIFGIEDGIKDRPQWKLGVKGEIPAELARLLPEPKRPLLSSVGMLIIGFLCVVIVYLAVD